LNFGINQLEAFQKPMNKEVSMFNIVLGILAILAGVGITMAAIMIIFRKDPIPEGCICKYTTLSIHINYDCPIHGDWR
jgi:hypothetical protein